MRHPGEQRYAVVSPFAAKYFLGRLSEGRPVTSATIRTDAHFYRRTRGEVGRALAAHLEAAWLQLQSAAADWSTEPTPTSARGSAAAEVADEVAESGVQTDDMSTKEAAMALGVTERRVRQLIGDGVLEAVKPDGRWRVIRRSVEACADSRSVRTEQPEEA